MQLLNFTVGAWLLFREKFSKGAKSLLCPLVDGFVKKTRRFFFGCATNTKFSETHCHELKLQL